MLQQIASRVVPICVIVAISLGTAGTAAAATKNGIKPLAPKAGTSIPLGKAPTFRMRVRGRGQVWVHVCRSKKKDSSGVICSKESIGRAKKKNGVFVYKPTFYDYPGFWLNRPGRYYWQAFRIACNSQDCEQEGPIVRFSVKAAAVPVPAPAPAPEPVADPTPTPAPPTGPCDPNYSGCLDPNAYDYDCVGGSGDGPLYTGAVVVYGDDHFDLDRDGDGVGCDNR